MTGIEPPVVTVVIPTFNRRELVRRAVDSVLCQSFGRFEVIVVDDGSTDGTTGALSGLDRRLRCLRTDNGPCGVSAARNVGLKAAGGELVAFLDSDNRWLAHHLAVVTRVLELRPDAVLACTCPGFRVAGRQAARKAVLVDPMPRVLVNNFVGYISCVAVRRAALEAVGGFDERLPVAEDSDLWMRLALEGRFAMLRHRTAIVQATRNSLRDRGRRSGAYLDAVQQTFDGIIDKLSESPHEERGLAAKARGGGDFVAALRALHEGREGDAEERLREACALLPELSREPSLVAGRLLFNMPSVHRPDERLRLFAAAASLWPNRSADTALALRGAAILTALRLLRLRTAVALACRMPLLPAASFTVRRAPAILVDVGRRRLDALRRRGEETHQARIHLDGLAEPDR